MRELSVSECFEWEIGISTHSENGSTRVYENELLLSVSLPVCMYVCLVCFSHVDVLLGWIRLKGFSLGF